MPSFEPAGLVRSSLVHEIKPKRRQSETDPDPARAAYMSRVDYTRCEKIWRGHWQ